MSDFIVYNKKTGEIFRTGNAPENMIKIQVNNENEAVIEGKADDVCDQIDLKTKKVMKDYKTSRKAIREAEEQKRIKDAPARAREILIQDRANCIVRKMAIAELTKEGKIKKGD